MHTWFKKRPSGPSSPKDKRGAADGLIDSCVRVKGMSRSTNTTLLYAYLLFSPSYVCAGSGLKSICLRWKFSISLAWSNGALLTGGGNRKSFRPSSSHTLRGLVKSRLERRDGDTKVDRGGHWGRGPTQKEHNDRWKNTDEAQWRKDTVMQWQISQRADQIS